MVHITLPWFARNNLLHDNALHLQDPRESNKREERTQSSQKVGFVASVTSKTVKHGKGVEINRNMAYRIRSASRPCQANAICREAAGGGQHLWRSMHRGSTGRGTDADVLPETSEARCTGAG